MGGKTAAIFTLIGDVAKGIVPVLLARELGLSASSAAYCGLCAFLGHLYPVYFDFRGGKGVATAMGVLAALHWPTFLLIAMVWLVVFHASRISSLAAIIAFFTAPMLVLMSKASLFYPVLVLSLLLLLRHYRNIIDLFRGDEAPITGDRDHPG